MNMYKLIMQYEYRRAKFLLLTVLVSLFSYISSAFWNNLTWDPDLDADEIISQTQFDIVTVYQFSFTAPSYAFLVSKTCSSATVCNINQIEDIFESNINRSILLLSGNCNVIESSKLIKIESTCPIIVNNTIKGYVKTSSILNMDRDYMILETKKISLLIAKSSYF